MQRVHALSRSDGKSNLAAWRIVADLPLLGAEEGCDEWTSGF